MLLANVLNTDFHLKNDSIQKLLTAGGNLLSGTISFDAV